ncbi:ubiquitin domain-containing protein UBFD1 [Trichonephila clavipes]|nr:ubiquitin domain-containing protein UBFD1 [Trichonephila clavipes]
MNTGNHPPVSTAPYSLSPNRKEPLRKEIYNLSFDIYQKQVETGGIIDIEAGKKISTCWKFQMLQLGSNTAENSVPDEVNDVDATPETDSSSKPEGNASVMPKDRASGIKDMRIDSDNEPKNKDVGHNGRTKNDRHGYNKQSRGNSNRNYSYRGNQRFNRYPKPNEQCFNRFKNRGRCSPERFNVEEQYAEVDYLPQNKSDSEDNSAEARHDTSLVTDFSLRPRSYIPSNKRNERTNYYDSNRKYDGEKKGNFYHRSNSDTRGKSEVNNLSDCSHILNESLNKESENISPSDKECFQNNKPGCDDKDESKQQDICAGNSSNCAFFDHQRRNAYYSDTHFLLKEGNKIEVIVINIMKDSIHRNIYIEKTIITIREVNLLRKTVSEGTLTEDHAGFLIGIHVKKICTILKIKRDYNRSGFSDPPMSNERSQFSERSREFSEKRNLCKEIIIIPRKVIQIRALVI